MNSRPSGYEFLVSCVSWFWLMPEGAVYQAFHGIELSACDAAERPMSAHPLEDPLEERAATTEDSSRGL